MAHPLGYLVVAELELRLQSQALKLFMLAEAGVAQLTLLVERPLD
jgi:hypothetical protein